MGNKMWKEIEQSNNFRSLKLKLRQVIGMDPVLTNDINLITEDYSGWQVVPGLLRKNDIVYSFGICDDIGFEIDALQKNEVNIFAFDPTPYSVEWVEKQVLPANFNFFPWAASATDGFFFLYPRISKKGKKSSVMYTFHQQEEIKDDGVKVKALSLKSIVTKLNHETINVLKMDIEGAEYEVLDDLLKSGIRPRMLLVEFHHRFKGIGKSRTINAVTALREQGYLIASVSVTGREVCFVHKSEVP